MSVAYGCVGPHLLIVLDFFQFADQAHEQVGGHEGCLLKSDPARDRRLDRSVGDGSMGRVTHVH